MEFKTELNPGDKLYTLSGDRLCSPTIEKVIASCEYNFRHKKAEEAIVKYELTGGGLTTWKIAYQNEIGKIYFKSKEELIASL